MSQDQPTTPTSLADRLEEDPPVSVKLRDGDVFAGAWDHLERGETDYGPCLVAVFTDPDTSGMLEPPEIPEGGRASLWLFHEALLSRLKRLRPAKGERIAVKRVGKKMGGNDRGYIDYAIVSENDQAGEVTWDQIAPIRSDGDDWQTGAFNDPPNF